VAFRSFESIEQARFNSSNSCEFLTLYENALDETILEGESSKPSRTFAPSPIRCKRVSWFRLRGVEPEQETIVDRKLNFTAKIGTACHQNIQELLSKKFGADWIDPEAYLKSKNLPYKYSCIKNGLETQIEIFDPVPIKFAPDGIIFWKGKYWLLEIKTSEYSSFDKLEYPKSQHLDQIKCYATILDIHNVLVLYQDRMYGGLKCYEVTVADCDMQEIWDMFKEVQDCVSKNIAPSKPVNQNYCSPSYCRYYNKCKEW
jgi:CRISPR/Cas system-associated exonuclease Cas4 (RecB family)